MIKTGRETKTHSPAQSTLPLTGKRTQKPSEPCRWLTIMVSKYMVGMEERERLTGSCPLERDRSEEVKARLGAVG